MKRILIFLITMTVFSGCNNPKTEVYLTEKINDSNFEYKLVNEKLTDTLKQFNRENKLIFFQIWNNGKLKETSIVDRSGKIRNLLYQEKNSNTNTPQNYYDKKDANFIVFPFDDDISYFYQNHISISRKSIFKDSLNIIEIYNFPLEHMLFSIPGEIEELKNENLFAKFKGENIIIKTERQIGDTLQLVLHTGFFRNQSKKEFNLLIK